MLLTPGRRTEAWFYYNFLAIKLRIHCRFNWYKSPHCRGDIGSIPIGANILSLIAFYISWSLRLLITVRFC